MRAVHLRLKKMVPESRFLNSETKLLGDACLPTLNKLLEDKSKPTIREMAKILNDLRYSTAKGLPWDKGRLKSFMNKRGIKGHPYVPPTSSGNIDSSCISVLKELLRLPGRLTKPEIAERLNKLGYLTAKGLPWTKSRLYYTMKVNKLKCQPYDPRIHSTIGKGHELRGAACLSVLKKLLREPGITKIKILMKLNELGYLTATGLTWNSERLSVFMSKNKLKIGAGDNPNHNLENEQ